MAAKKKSDENIQYYLVIEDFRSDINNIRLIGKKGEKIILTPTQLSVLKRFVLPL